VRSWWLASSNASTSSEELRSSDIHAVYVALLQREPSSQEVELWLGAQSLSEFLAGVLASEEYRALISRPDPSADHEPVYLNCWIDAWEQFSRPPGQISTDGVVMVGRSGHLFIHGGTNDNVALQRGEVDLPDRWIEEWQTLVEDRLTYAERTGRQLVCLIVPEKLVVYADRYPHELVPVAPRPVLRLLGEGGLPLLYPVDHLVEARQSGEAYLFTDSHLTPMGNRVLASAIVERLGASSALLPRIPDSHNPHLGAGDMGLHFDPPIAEVMQPLVGLSQAEIISDNWQEIAALGAHVGIVRIFHRKDAPDNRTVVIFGDSYAFGGEAYQGLAWFLAQIFREVHFIWAPFGWDPDYLERVGAECVICECAERFTRRVPDKSMNVEALAQETISKYRS
jgi:hypothetical protein